MMKHIFLFFFFPTVSRLYHGTTNPPEKMGKSLKIGYLGGSRSSCPMFAPVPIFWHRFRSHCCSSSSTSSSTGPAAVAPCIYISAMYSPTTRLLPLILSILFRHFHQHFQHFLASRRRTYRKIPENVDWFRNWRPPKIEARHFLKEKK